MQRIALRLSAFLLLIRKGITLLLLAFLLQELPAEKRQSPERC